MQKQANCPVIDTIKDFEPEELYERLHTAACGFHVQSTWKVFPDMVIRFFTDTTGPSLYNAGIIALSQSGFFLKTGDFVSTSSFTIILATGSVVQTFSLPYCYRPGTNLQASMQNVFAANLAFKKPRFDESGNTKYTARYKQLMSFQDVLRDICAGGIFARWFEFYADVVHSDKTRCANWYRMYLSGFHAETGIALYKVDVSDQWNRQLPVLHQKYLVFGNSKACRPGSRVHVLYDSKCAGPMTMGSGRVANNSTLVRDGGVTYEVFVTDIVVSEGCEGAPIVDACGRVVAIAVGVTSAGHLIGVAESFAAPIIQTLIDSACNPDCTKYAAYVRVWGCRMYRHGVLKNLQYHTTSVFDLTQAFLRVSTDGSPCDSCNQSGIDTFAGDCVSCCQGPSYWQERFYTYENGQIDRTMQGVTLDTDPCGNLADATEKYEIHNPNYGPNVVKYFSLERGDRITGIAGRQVGSLPWQATPDTIVNTLAPGDCVSIVFGKQVEVYTQPHLIDTRLEDSLSWVSQFKPILGPCLRYISPITNLCNGNAGLIVDDIMEIMRALNAHFHMMHYFLTACPQVYRQCFLSNQLAMLTHLKELLALVIIPKPSGNIAFPPLSNLIPTPLSTALTFSQLSRTIVSFMAIPAQECCIRPITFIDYTMSLPTPNTVCAFEQLIPNFLGLLGAELTDFIRAFDATVPAAMAAAPCMASLGIPGGGPASNAGRTMDDISAHMGDFVAGVAEGLRRRPRDDADDAADNGPRARMG